MKNQPFMTDQDMSAVINRFERRAKIDALLPKNVELASYTNGELCQAAAEVQVLLNVLNSEIRSRLTNIVRTPWGADLRDPSKEYSL